MEKGKKKSLIILFISYLILCSEMANDFLYIKFYKSSYYSEELLIEKKIDLFN